MRKINFIIIVSLITVTFLFVFFLNPINKSYVIIKGKLFFVDVAKTEKQQTDGLSIYSHLSQNKGMVFPFKSSGYHAFWMKDMKFPIDIIYIENNHIVDIFTNLPSPKSETETPVTVTPKSKANYVLEINAGLSQKYNFKEGDTVKFNL